MRSGRAASSARREARRHRSGVGLAFNPEHAVAAGAEVTNSALRCVLLDLTGAVRAESRCAVPPGAAPDAVIDLLVDALAGPSYAEPQHVSGVGVAVPGQLDPGRDVSLSIPGLRGWRDVPLRAGVERPALGLPAELDWRVHHGHPGRAVVRGRP